MKSVGISITRDSLSAVLWEQTLFSSRMEGACTVPCGEPYGRPEEIALLAEEVRKIAGPGDLPPAVISLPPSWTFLRRIHLPVSDLPRAKKMHVTELEGTLPIEDEEILSDILPAPSGEPGAFLAVAARRSVVEKTVDAYSSAGFRLDRAVTDHVSLLSALLSSKSGFSGAVLSGLNDFVVLTLSGGAVVSARQFPETLSENPEELGNVLREILSDVSGVAASNSIAVFGELPASLSGVIPDAVPVAYPGVPGDASPLAYGASITPFSGKATGGFSLRTSAEAESESTRMRTRFRIAAAAAAIAVLAGAGAIEIARWAEADRVSRIRAAIRQEFTEAVPGVKVVVQETAQIREKIQSLSRQRKELGVDFPEPSVLLEKVSRALPEGRNISVREVSFDSGRLRLAGDAESARLVETYRTNLVDAFGPETAVTVQESGGSARGGNVRYTILIEKGGNGRAP